MSWVKLATRTSAPSRRHVGADAIREELDDFVVELDASTAAF